MVKQRNKRLFKSKDDVISMFLGLVVVTAVAGFIINFIEKGKGNIDIPGVSSDLEIKEIVETNKNNIESVIVENNDSLWKIAQRVYGDAYKWTEIAKANNLTNPNILYRGQKLVLPKIEKDKVETISTQNDVPSKDKLSYIVVRGDNLWNIATKYYGDGYQWVKIWRDNRSKLNSPDKLEIGMSLMLYGKI